MRCRGRTYILHACTYVLTCVRTYVAVCVHETGNVSQDARSHVHMQCSYYLIMCTDKYVRTYVCTSYMKHSVYVRTRVHTCTYLHVYVTVCVHETGNISQDVRSHVHMQCCYHLITCTDKYIIHET